MQEHRPKSSSYALLAEPASTQMHFNWAEEVEASNSAASDCVSSHRDSNNLVYQKPYAANIPAYRRIVPKGSL